MILKGTCAAPGIAAGRIFIYKKDEHFPAESFIPAGEEQSHLERYESVKKQAVIELEKLKLDMQKNDPEKAEIFKAHQSIVDDIVINEEIPDRITNERWSGDWAIYQVYETCLAALRQVSDPLIAERVSDFEDVRSLLLKLWHGEKNEGLALTEPVIIAADELLPSDTASMDRDKALAILTETGGLASHSAIIARSYGIPTVLGIKGLLDNVRHGQTALVNAGEGTVILEPDDAVTEEYLKKSETFRRGRQEDQMFLEREGRTACGVKIDIGLNIASAGDEELKAADYADSVGLFRTEFLYMGRDTLPDEDEQYSVYRKVLERFGERPVILRTLDIGGDKKLPGMERVHEENPFLGNRGIRFCFSHPDIFKTQIRAALRACVYGNLWIMLPMVAAIGDIRKAKEQIAAIGEELKKEGETCGKAKIGIMIEIPSIALTADKAASEVDFASIGSNDLCQYLCAADRMNSAMEPYYQSYHPAMFRLIKEAAASFTNAGKPISICGELGADPLAIPVLVGLGMRKLSMGAASVAAAKRAIASVTVKKTQEAAEAVLQFSTAAEVKKFLAL